MTQEEKAKRFDEALAMAKDCITYIPDDAINQYMLDMFPELKEEESDDEKIRKVLISRFNESGELDGISYDNIRIWLEKQGEQKSTRPIWKYKKDHTPLLMDSLILNKYGCVAKSPSCAIVSDVWVLDYDELAKLPKEEIEKQSEQKPIDNVTQKIHI